MTPCSTHRHNLLTWIKNNRIFVSLCRRGRLSAFRSNAAPRQLPESGDPRACSICLLHGAFDSGTAPSYPRPTPTSSSLISPLFMMCDVMCSNPNPSAFTWRRFQDLIPSYLFRFTVFKFIAPNHIRFGLLLQYRYYTRYFSTYEATKWGKLSQHPLLNLRIVRDWIFIVTKQIVSPSMGNLWTSFSNYMFN